MFQQRDTYKWHVAGKHRLQPADGEDRGGRQRALLALRRAVPRDPRGRDRMEGEEGETPHGCH